jgi:hypothetical protein
LGGHVPSDGDKLKAESIAKSIAGGETASAAQCGDRWDSVLGLVVGCDGLLLAVPLTALVKLVADLRPSLCHLSNILTLTPRPIPRWVRYGETTLERAIPYLRGRPGLKPSERVIGRSP